MESVYSFLNSKIVKKSIPEALSIIQFLLFNNFYKILYYESNEKLVLSVSGKEILIVGNLEGVDLVKLFFDHANLYCDTQFVVELQKQYRLQNNKLIQIVYPPKRFLTNVSNSCALDSLLSIVLFAKSGYFLQQIVKSVKNTYPPWIDVETITRLSNRVRDNIMKLYNTLPSCKDTKYDMGNAREIQKDLIYYLKEDCSDVKSAYELWNILCMMYNNLYFYLQTPRHKQIGNVPTQYAALPFDDDILDDEDERGYDTLNTVVDPPHLVVLNDTVTHNWEFREINGYELIGVIVHTGGHYYSRIKIYDDWYEYDDLRSDIIKMYKGDKILVQTGRARNVMMFYILGE